MDWYGFQLAMANTRDRTQYIFNSGNIWRRHTDSDPGSETWSEWIKISQNEGLIAYSAQVAPTPVTDSNDNSIATTGWVNERIQENVPDFGDWESLEASGTASKSGIFVVISKTNTTVEIYVDEILRAHTVRRDSYGQGKTSITCPVRKGSTYRINGAETISFIPLV